MDIWCIGDINYLVTVLNGLAMLGQSGLFTDLVRLGLLLAVLAAAVSAMYRTGGVPWGQFIVGYGLFYLLFGQVTTVWVHDYYTLQSRQVDNVPWGVAFTGSVCSKMAHEITESVSQAFSMPRMDEGGFAAPAKLLVSARGLDLAGLHGGRVAKTLENYCAECTATGLSLGALDEHAIKVNPDPWAAMRWDSDIYTTKTYLPTDPSGGREISCTEAWGQIDNYLRGQLWTDWDEHLRAVLCPPGHPNCNPSGLVQSALDSLTQAALDGRNYMLASVVLKAFEGGQIKASSFFGKPELAILVGQAREQRNLQISAEGPLFYNLSRPMMAFFEGFLFAITPFYALLVAFVPAGFRLIFKYLAMFLWVQIWLPILAILNQYALIAAQNKLTCLQATGSAVTSIQGHIMAASQLQDWLGTVGLLIASTPAISLAVLFGGAITMTHLASRLQTADHVAERSFRPDILSNAPAQMVAPSFQHDPMQGRHLTGLPQYLGSYNYAQTSTTQESSTRAEMVSSAQQYTNTLLSGVSQAHHGGYGGTGGVTTSDGVTSGLDSTYASAEAWLRQNQSQFGLSNEGVLTAAHQIAHKGMVEGHIGGRLGLDTGKIGGGGKQLPGASQTEGKQSPDMPVVGAGLSLGGNIGRSRTDTLSGKITERQAQKINEALNTAKNSTGQSNLSAALRTQLAYQVQQGVSREFREAYGEDAARRVQDAASRVVQAREDHSEAQQFSAQIGEQRSMPKLQWARILAAEQGDSARALHDLQNRVPDLNVGGRVYALRDQIRVRSQDTIPKNEAGWIALGDRLKELQSKGNIEAGEQLLKLHQIPFGTQFAPGLSDSPAAHRALVDRGQVVAAGDEAEARGRSIQAPDEGAIHSRLTRDRGDLQRLPFNRGQVVADHRGKAAGILDWTGGQARDQLYSDYNGKLAGTKLGDIAPLKQTATLQMIRGVAGQFDPDGERPSRLGPLTQKSDRAALGEMLRAVGEDKSYVGGPRGATVWGKYAGEIYQGYYQQAIERGLPEPLAQVFAAGATETTRQRLEESGYLTGSLVRGPGGTEAEAREIGQQALEARTAYHREHGASNPEQLAREEVDRASRAGQIGFTQEIGAVAGHDQTVKNLEQAQQLRQRQLSAPERLPRGAGIDEGKFDLRNYGPPDPAVLNRIPKYRPLTNQQVQENSEKYIPAITRASRDHGVPEWLIRGVIQKESSFNPRALGPVTKSGRAKGLMQLTDATAAQVGVTDPWNPEQNIMGGTKYLKKLLSDYDGDVKKALGSYNAGPDNVNRNPAVPFEQTRAHAFRETREFIPQALAHAHQFRQAQTQEQVYAEVPQAQAQTSPSGQASQGRGPLSDPVWSGAAQAQPQTQPAPSPQAQAQGKDHGQVDQVAMASNPLAPNSQAAPPSEKSWGDVAWSLIGPSQAHAAEGPPMAGAGGQGPTQGQVSGATQPEPTTQIKGTTPGPEQVQGREGEASQMAGATQPEPTKIKVDPSRNPIYNEAAPPKPPKPKQPKTTSRTAAESDFSELAQTEEIDMSKPKLPSDHFKSWGITQTQPPAQQPGYGKKQDEDEVPKTIIPGPPQPGPKGD
ncbi:MAG: conjugal transfer protein TraG N-terminal domain-containing protein [Desulfobacca sp.]|nr:conjugal transfer protein TraG N-terminal domain-containing protein [Desulfobacca sp.]